LSLHPRVPLHHPHHHSFPTRRSSDLVLCTPFWEEQRAQECAPYQLIEVNPEETPLSRFATRLVRDRAAIATSRVANRESGVSSRSEEHTSELQSPYDLVCRLLLEKKK